jgi:hypothetical protein
MKLSLFFLFTVCCIGLSVAQEGTKIKKASSSLSSIAFSKGDTLKLGFFEKNVFSNKKEYQNVYVKDKKNVCGFAPCKVDLSDSLLIVKNTYQHTDHCLFGFQQAQVIEASTAHATYFIPIDKALSARELIAFPNTYLPKKCRNLDEVAVLSLNLNFLNAKNDDYIMRYIRAVNPEKAKLYDQNPAALTAEKSIWDEELTKIRKSITVKDTFLLTVPVYIGKYAVDKNQFLIQDNPDGYGSKSIKFSEDTKVQFDNFSKMWTLNASKNQADFFLNATLPDYNGNRKAYLQVKAICTHVERNPKAGPPTPDSMMSNILHVKVLEMNAVDSQHLQYNQIGFSRSID